MHASETALLPEELLVVKFEYFFDSKFESLQLISACILSNYPIEYSISHKNSF